MSLVARELGSSAERTESTLSAIPRKLKAVALRMRNLHAHCASPCEYLEAAFSAPSWARTRSPWRRDRSRRANSAVGSLLPEQLVNQHKQTARQAIATSVRRHLLWWPMRSMLPRSYNPN